MSKGYSIFQRGSKGSWYVAWTDGTGKRQTIKGSIHKSIASEIGRAKAKEADRVRGGVISPLEAIAAAAGRDLIKVHVEGWKSHLTGLGRTKNYISIEISRINYVFEKSAIARLNDLSAEKAQAQLAAIAGNASPQTANHYRTALRMFVRWCFLNGKLLVNPLVNLGVIATDEPTFRRQPLDDKQLFELFAAAEKRKSKSPFKGIDRAMYYRTMAYTGLRRTEAASLIPESFDLQSQHKSVTISAAYSKRRRRDVLPIRDDFAAVLIPWLSRKELGKPIFRIAKHMNFERVFRLDCAAAGIEVAEGQRLGAHSLRRFFITSVVRAGGLAVGQELARHSTPALTKAYTDLTFADHQKGLSGLPSLSQNEKENKKKRA